MSLLKSLPLSELEAQQKSALPEDVHQLLFLQKLVKQENLSWFLLGGGSNILIADGLFKGIMIHPNFPEEISVLEESKGSITVEVPANAGLPG